jgi:hypothetical protein
MHLAFEEFKEPTDGSTTRREEVPSDSIAKGTPISGRIPLIQVTDV